MELPIHACVQASDGHVDGHAAIAITTDFAGFGFIDKPDGNSAGCD